MRMSHLIRLEGGQAAGQILGKKDILALTVSSLPLYFAQVHSVYIYFFFFWKKVSLSPVKESQA